MGCDIHTMAEVKVNDWRKPIDGGGYQQRWSKVKAPVFVDAYYREFDPITIDNTPYTNQPYRGRNYDLFAVLADVRNGRGFAGVPTGDRVEPIANPKGVPHDASKQWKRYVEHWGADLHSTSYFTLAELLAAMPLLTQHQRKTGVITEAEYLRLKREGGSPNGWSGDVGGGGIRVVTVDEYEAGERAAGDADAGRVMQSGSSDGLDALIGDANSRTYVRYYWETTLEDATSWFIDHTMDGLRRIAPRIGGVSWDERRKIMAENDGKFIDPRPIDATAVRIVFGFDN